MGDLQVIGSEGHTAVAFMLNMLTLIFTMVSFPDLHPAVKKGSTGVNPYKVTERRLSQSQGCPRLYCIHQFSRLTFSDVCRVMSWEPTRPQSHLHLSRLIASCKVTQYFLFFFFFSFFFAVVFLPTGTEIGQDE